MISKDHARVTLCVVVIPNFQISFANNRPYENSSDVSAYPLIKGDWGFKIDLVLKIVTLFLVYRFPKLVVILQWRGMCGIEIIDLIHITIRTYVIYEFFFFFNCRKQGRSESCRSTESLCSTVAI